MRRTLISRLDFKNYIYIYIFDHFKGLIKMVLMFKVQRRLTIMMPLHRKTL